MLSCMTLMHYPMMANDHGIIGLQNLCDTANWLLSMDWQMVPCPWLVVNHVVRPLHWYPCWFLLVELPLYLEMWRQSDHCHWLASPQMLKSQPYYMQMLLAGMVEMSGGAVILCASKVYKTSNLKKKKKDIIRTRDRLKWQKRESCDNCSWSPFPLLV